MTVPQSYLEAVYQRPSSTQRWLQTLLEAVRSDLDVGLGLAAFSFALGEERGLATAAVADALDGMAAAELEQLALTAATRRVVDVAEHGGSWALLVPLGDGAARIHVGSRSALLLIAIHPRSGATVIAVPGLSADAWRDRPRNQLERLAAHLACALRLRCVPEWRSAHGAAAADCAQGARSALGTGDLRSAAVAADDLCQSLAQSSADAADNAWRGLLAGQLRQVDSFEREGRRYIVAASEGTQGLRAAPTPRQCRMLAMRSGGQSLKSIAAELQCSISTVSSEISRALRLLGIPSVSELGSGEEGRAADAEAIPGAPGVPARGDARRQHGASLRVAASTHRQGA